MDVISPAMVSTLRPTDTVDKKSDILVHTRSLSSVSSTAADDDPPAVVSSAKPTAAAPRHGGRLAAYHPTLADRSMDVVRTATVVGRSLLAERRHPYRALSERGKFVHHYAEPLSSWWGRNPRVLTTACRASVRVRDPQPEGAPISGQGSAEGEDGETQKEEYAHPSSVIINGASHNYAGFYAPTALSEEMHRVALDQLPVADDNAVPLLRDAARSAIAQFFNAEFCFITSTGYGSNYVGFPAVVDALGIECSEGTEAVAVLMDEKCHNSEFTGVFLAHPGCVRKFKHNDMTHLASLLGEIEMEGKCKRVLVAIEGLYSMEGSIPPLSAIYRLKKQYGFTLLCDEAHSFLSIGSSGRGCLEFWNDTYTDDPVPISLFDLRTATLSKAVGGLGGFICGRGSHFASAISSHLGKSRNDGTIEGVLSSTLLQALWVLGQPARAARNLKHLHDAASFCRAELARFGVRVYGEGGTPILPLFAGPPVLAGKLSYELRRRGLLATPIATPAVPYWESRVRVNLSGEHKDDEINALIDCVISAVRECGLGEKVDKATQRIIYVSGSSFTADEEASEEEVVEATDAHRSIMTLISRSAAPDKDTSTDDTTYVVETRRDYASIVAAGHVSQAKYGVGSGGARWICGTYPAHLAVESLLCEATQAESALTYADATIGLASTVAALCRPLLSFEKHTLFLPRADISSFEQGAAIAPKTGAPLTQRYDSLEDLCFRLAQLDRRNASSVSALLSSCMPSSGSGKAYATICLDVNDVATIASLPMVLERIVASVPATAGATILLHWPRCLAAQPMVDLGSARLAARPDVQVLLSGAFYGMFGIPGGFVAGSATLVQELRYWSRGYMFTTSPPAFLMDMLRCAIELEIGKQ